ncbi:HCNGP-like protein-domain-containing protein [Tuber borchii]|uniref:HCNGP-like protein-domain-containing protein n=1 Tax=Tuber borchii TaxID=42251 RepID=A0A2T6ZEL5_TUBBO|nr:HCNGP-like protein-domain-containing protein [Tuber borchii]
MALVEYGSGSESDQEEIQPEQQPVVAASTAPLQIRKARPTPGSPLSPKSDGASKSLSSSTLKRKASVPSTHITSHSEITPVPAKRVEPEPQIREPEPTDDIGPIQGPARPPQSPSSAPQTPGPEPLSPYSLNRATIRSLTLPTSIPEIPPSPPGEEHPDVSSKFGRFRELKKQGIHFNEQLSRSSTLQNPNLFEKLTEFVGVTGGDQYISCLPKELWDPFGFPEEAFADRLAKTQIEVLEKRQAEERSRIEFVGSTATSAPPAPSSRDRRAGNGGGRSAAERVMAGLDRGRDGERDTGPRKKESSGRWDERPKERKREGDGGKKRSRSSSRERSVGRGRHRDYDRA